MADDLSPVAGLGITERSSIPLVDLPATYSQAAEATWRRGVDEGKAWYRGLIEMPRLQDAPLPGSLMGLEFGEPEPPAPSEGRVSADEARNIARSRGLTLTDPAASYTPAALNAVLDWKQEAAYQNFTLQQARTGALGAVGLFGVGLAASFTDPLNLGLAFVPVVGQARAALWATRYGTTMGRAAVGAVEGTVGAAIYEPFMVAGKSAIDADYEVQDSFLNLVFGGLAGGGLHTVGGKIKDVWQARNDGLRVSHIDTLSSLSPAQHEAVVRAAHQMAMAGRKVDLAGILEAAAPEWAPSLRGRLLAGTTDEAARDAAVRSFMRWGREAPEQSDLLAGLGQEFAPGGGALPVIDTARLEVQALRAQEQELTGRLTGLRADDPALVDRLARLEQVEQELRANTLTKEERRALKERRDALLENTSPERLREASGAGDRDQRRLLARELDELREKITEAEGRMTPEGVLIEPPTKQPYPGKVPFPLSPEAQAQKAERALTLQEQMLRPESMEGHDPQVLAAAHAKLKELEARNTDDPATLEADTKEIAALTASFEKTLPPEVLKMADEFTEAADAAAKDADALAKGWEFLAGCTQRSS